MKNGASANITGLEWYWVFLCKVCLLKNETFSG